MPKAEPGRFAILGILLAVPSAIAGILCVDQRLWIETVTADAVFGFGCWLFTAARWHLPRDCRNVAGLVRHVALLNVASLAEEGARVGKAEVWRVLVHLLSRDAHLPATGMTPDMFVTAK